MRGPKPQRIRCPVHNLIEFGVDQFEQTLWRAIQTPPFQRLRRIRQLGFSELVFPGATHTRFAHSLGVFHMARRLMRVIRRHVEGSGRQYREHQAQVALAAALLHDIGHGMFSHAFEPLAKRLKLPFAEHADVSAALIRDSEIPGVLNAELGSGFANDVATLIERKEPGNLYDAVVSSQFDADRLDYMQRDRLMTGVQSSGVDPVWLLANLEVASVQIGADDTSAGSIETLVLGPKAVQTAESYVLSLFHLYPNVYLHKATRGTELIFAALMRRLLRLAADGHTANTGLTERHPLIRFAKKPDDMAHALALDDLVFWGALPMLEEAEDGEIARLAGALRGRRLFRCIDVRARIADALPAREGEARETHQGRIALACTRAERLLRMAPNRILTDSYSRSPYKRVQESQSPLNRILIRTTAGAPPQDMADLSPIIAAAEPFHILRAYVARDDDKAGRTIENIVRTSARGGEEDGQA
jgi:HD superfamily phosphohydrolase